MTGWELVLTLSAIIEISAGVWLLEHIIEVRRLRAEARNLLREIRYPNPPDEVREALEKLAAYSSTVSTAFRFRGQLLADKLRHNFPGVPDVILSTILYRALTVGVDVEHFAGREQLDPFGVMVSVLSCAAAELSSLERELAP